MVMLRTTALALIASIALACGGDDETKATPPANHAPTLTGLPAAAIAVGQGQTVALPITLEDADGDAIEVSFPALPAGLEAEVVLLDEAGAKELSLHAGYALAGPVSFDIVIDDGKDNATMTVSVEVAPIRWLPRQTWNEPAGPAAREHGSVIVDEEGGQAFLFEGSGYAPQLTSLGDAWRYDLASGAWAQVTPTGEVPPPAGSRRVAQIPGTKVAYLWGGYGGSMAQTNFDDLYRVTVEGQGLVFKLITQNNAPPVRALHGFAYDAVTDRFVVFGGAGTKPLGDTWIGTIEGDVATWTELVGDPKPSPRYGFFAGVDEERGRLIVFSGAQGFASLNPAQDTWALDMRAEPPAWELVSDGLAAGDPPGRRNGCAIFDPSGPRLFVFGGTADAMTSTPGLFALDARPGKAAWSQLSLADEPPLRSSGFGFHDASGDRTLLGFGNDDSIYRDWAVIGY
jgi:hypothetical protein